MESTPSIEKTAQILTTLGLTETQAKIYARICNVEKATINEIAKIASVDRSQTFRAVVELEKKGLLEKALGRPIEYRAPSLDQVLPTMLAEKKKETSHIVKEVSKLMHTLPREREVMQEEESVLIVPRAEMIVPDIRREMQEEGNVYNLTTAATLREIENLDRPLKKLELSQGMLKQLKRGVEITMIVEKPTPENILPTYINNLKKYPNFSLRFLPSVSEINMVIHENKKVWIKISSASYYKSSWLVSNNENILRLAKILFDKVKVESVES